MTKTGVAGVRAAIRITSKRKTYCGKTQGAIAFAAMSDKKSLTRPSEMDSDTLREWLAAVQNDFALVLRTVLEKEGLTRYALARRLSGIVSQRSVYDFLEGKDTRLKTLLAIFDACNLEIGIGVREPRLRPSRDYSKSQLIEQLKQVQERKSIGRLIYDWDRTRHFAFLKGQWDEFEKRRNSPSGCDS